jgi:hypothetical protein
MRDLAVRGVRNARAGVGRSPPLSIPRRWWRRRLRASRRFQCGQFKRWRSGGRAYPGVLVHLAPRCGEVYEYRGTFDVSRCSCPEMPVAKLERGTPINAAASPSPRPDAFAIAARGGTDHDQRGTAARTLRRRGHAGGSMCAATLADCTWAGELYRGLGCLLYRAHLLSRAFSVGALGP